MGGGRGGGGRGIESESLSLYGVKHRTIIFIALFFLKTIGLEPGS